MKKNSEAITVVFARFGEEPQEIQADKDISVGDFLKEESIELNSGEKIWVNGERASKKDLLEDKDVVNVVASKEGGVAAM